MGAIYLQHPDHGQKVATSDLEANYDKGNGWVEFDPSPPLPDFLTEKKKSAGRPIKGAE